MSDGYIVYQGMATQSPAYFTELGYNMPQFGNPSDFFIQVLSVNYPKTEEDEQKLQMFNS